MTPLAVAILTAAIAVIGALAGVAFSARKARALAAITITSAAAVTTPALATLSRTLAPITVASAATVTAPGATATLSQTLAAITLSSAVHVGADLATWAWRTGRTALRRFTGYRRRGR